MPEYWVVDPDRTTLDVWDFASGEEEPTVFRAEDTLPWAPVEGGPALEVEVGEVTDG